jgi:hypothetical protein
MVSSSQNSDLLNLFCPYLEKTVILKERIWRYKILPDHPEMKGHFKLVQQTLENQKGVAIFRKIYNPKKLAIFKETYYFMPHNRYLKIALEFTGESTAVITTCHGCDDIPLDMERL